MTKHDNLSASAPLSAAQPLLDSARLVAERIPVYGEPLAGMTRAAELASLKLNRTVTAYEVAIVLESVKDARRAVSPEHEDSHVDGLSYRAFAAALRPVAKAAPPVGKSTLADADIAEHLRREQVEAIRQERERTTDIKPWPEPKGRPMTHYPPLGTSDYPRQEPAMAKTTGRVTEQRASIDRTTAQAVHRGEAQVVNIGPPQTEA